MNSKLPPDELRKEIAQGLFYTHIRLSENTKDTLQISSFLYSLIELLSEKGIISIDELDQRKLKVAERLVKKSKDKGLGVLLQDPENDKYSFEDQVKIDCPGIIPVCKAACCRIPFALSRQDLHEGVVEWSLGEPYLINHNPKGYCSHLDTDGFACTIYEHRPLPCRAYDCRKDKRIWLDFDKRKLDPQVNRADWPGCLKQETKEK
jgi:Fe-S-cluster containining protein